MKRGTLVVLAKTLGLLAVCFEEAAKKNDSTECRNICAAIRLLRRQISFKGWLTLPIQL
jgi:hypothetical protein